VLHGGAGRGLIAIDPRACVGDPAFDAVDWVLWATDDPRLWKSRSRELAGALRADADGLWAWCAACAAILAASEVARDGPSGRVQALLAVAA
jgi:streptomycin 6-kinase